MRPVDGERTLPRAYTIGAAAALLLVVTVALSIFLGVQTRTQFEEIETSWRAYAGGTDRKGAWISALRGHLGYGGIIHHFKNYVLRHDAVYLREARAQLAQFRHGHGRVSGHAARRARAPCAGVHPGDRRRLPREAADRHPGRARGLAARADRPAGQGQRLRRDFAPSPISRGSGRPRARSARGRVGRAVAEGQALIEIGFLALGALAFAALAIRAMLGLLLRDMRRAVARLAEELVQRTRLGAHREPAGRGSGAEPSHDLHDRHGCAHP